MKKFLILLLMVAGPGLFITGCGDEDSLPDYYIQFKADGVLKLYSDSLTGTMSGVTYDGTPLGNWYSAESSTVLFASEIPINLDSSPVFRNFMLIGFGGNGAGTYTSTASSSLQYRTDGEEMDTGGLTVNIEVDTYDPVGGVISGTFSGTVSSNSGADTVVITDGEFRVLRIADDSFGG